jgi:2,3-bisphosphoglycerate-independent phosphoglycerate mutase
MSNDKTNKVMLTILDGWGYRKEKDYNAVATGNHPIWERLLKENPSANLITFGEDVGLPEGQMGNSEVGHTNIGAGRVVYQDLPRITLSIKHGEFAKNEKILESMRIAKANKKPIHIMGLFSNGGVHAHMDHYLYAAELFAKEGINVILHIFTDGRDTPPQSAIKYIDSLDLLLENYHNIKVATVCGRYYAMDRDNRWERVSLAYNAIVSAKSDKNYSSAKQAIEQAYSSNETDEFIKPVVIGNYKGMNDGDLVFMVNFRSDRAREILDCLLISDFSGFEREKIVKIANPLGMVTYSDKLDKVLNTVFEPSNLHNTIGEWLCKNGLTQLRVAETEKYPHVTFFFSGGQEDKFKGEDRILIPSPKVATYDLQPEMSAFEITDGLVTAIDSKRYDFIVVNYANGDMVGHTGVMEAAVKATEAVDECLGDLEKAVIKNNYTWLIIADHGNCETMWDKEHNVPHTQHTTNLVKIILVNAKDKTLTLKDGRLADVAPTLLELMNIEKPKEMDGISLLKK